MKLARMLLLLTSAVFACQLSAAFGQTKENGPAGITTAQIAIPPSGRGYNRVLIKALSPKNSMGRDSATKSVTLNLPLDIKPETLKIVLNGEDVTARFSETSCNGQICESASLTSTDGLAGGKNVLYAMAKKSNGSLVSSRLRFPGDETQPVAQTSMAKGRLSANVASGLPTNSDFLPPSVAFNVAPGGWQSGQPWITVGTLQTYPDPNSGYSCSGIYTAVVLDRKTLAEKTAAPESSPNCLTNYAALTSYVQTLTSSDLVIIGTNSGQQTDAGGGAGYLNTNAIGGTAYNCGTCSAAAQSIETPISYLMIGAGGAAPGSAYENYDTNPPHETFGAFATGMLEEDANGNYNFQSSTRIEYTVIPNDPNNNNQTTITLQGTAALSPYRAYNDPNKQVFYSPANETNGFWLLALRRDDLDYQNGMPNNAPSNICVPHGNDAKQQTDIMGCGQFFATGSTDPGTAIGAFNGLLGQLGQLSFNDLVFLVSVGNAVNPSYTSAYGLAQDSQVGSTAYAFGQTLESYGGTPGQILSLYASGTAYSLITCYGCGNSLTGHAILSTTANSQQGQTGTVHGLLARNINGLYWPGRASQESTTQNESNQGADFTLSIAGSSPPVEWPALSGTLLPNASSVEGQVAAYHYLSYQLVTQHYIQGAEGNYLDDIHFYFTGSNNTYLDYHTFDPVNVPFPDPSTPCYTWADPVSSTTLTCFTPNDLAAVASQVSAEIVDLDNVLQFMVNGSTNLKDVVAAGNGSAALALIGAGSAVEGSNLQPSPGTQVNVSSSSILSLFSSLVNLGLQVASDGLVNAGDLEDISQVGSTIADMFDLSSSVAGGYTTDGSTALPSPDYPVKIAIANLANSGLQQQLTAGFDTELDNILGDWGKLSAIGPLVTNSNNQAFYSPNQAAQNAAVVAFGQAAQRNFYMTLLPISYSVQYYPAWWTQTTFNPPNPPNMGNLTEEDCNSWYPWGNTTLWPLVTVYHPSYLGSERPDWYGTGVASMPLDFYIIASQTINNRTHSDQTIAFLDSQVASTLFSASSLNMPIDPLVMPHGPMTSVFWDATNGFDGYPAKQTYPCGVTSSSDLLGAAPPSPYITSTSLVAPQSSVLEESIDLQATVTSAAGVPQGTVSFEMGDTVLGTASLDSTGNAHISAKGLSLGSNSIIAYYLVNDPYYSSQSAPATVMVYTNEPSMDLSLSSSSLSVSYGVQSSPVALQVSSKYGLAGQLTFGCTGLPASMSCIFNPPQITITAGNNISTSLIVSSPPVQSAGMLLPRKLGGILAFGCSMLCLWQIRKGKKHLYRIACWLLLAAISIGCTLGCGGDSKPSSTQETGSKTILVNVTAGSTTKTIPLVINIQ